MPDLSPSAVFAAIAIAGFAVQRTVEFVDPFVSWAIRSVRSSARTPPALDAWETEIKKTALLAISFLLACVVVAVTELRLLSLIPDMGEVPGDMFVTALVLSAGTESISVLIMNGGIIWKTSTMLISPPRARAFASSDSAWIASRRSTGFCMFVASVTVVLVTLLCSSPSSARRRETGMLVRNASPGIPPPVAR